MSKFHFFFLILFPFALQSQSWKPVNGSADHKDHYTAFTNATIFVKKGTILQEATLLIRDNRIVAVGKEVEFPKNTLTIDLDGKFIYPSFIDLYSSYGIPEYKNESASSQKPQLESNKPNLFYWNEAIKTENKAIDILKVDEEAAKKYRQMGFGSVLSHQMDGIIRGTSALVSLGEDDEKMVLKAEAAMQYALKKGKSKQTYPTSLMGIIALIRQVHYDARWYESHASKKEYNRSLEVLNNADSLPKIIEAGDVRSQLRAAKIANEFDFQFILKGDGHEYKRLKELKATNSPLIVPVNFPKPYDVSDPYDAQQLSLAKMKEWELAPYNLRLLIEHQLPFAITTEGLSSEKDFFKNIRLSIENGADRNAIINSLTEYPAQLMGLDHKAGKLEPDYLANFIICSDSLFTEENRIYSNWVQGKEFHLEEMKEIDYQGNYSLNINKSIQLEVVLSREKGQWKAKVRKKGEGTLQAADLKLSNHRIALAFNMDRKAYRLSGSINDAQSRIWSGKTIIDNQWVDWGAIKMTRSKLSDKEKGEKSKDKGEVPAILFPNMAYGWDSLPQKPQPLLFRNATIWTNEKEGVLKNHDLLVHEGKILMVGYKINMEVMFPKLVDEVREINAENKHLTSGIVDEHSHIAIDHGVNESGQAITSEVRIGDVINSEDINIYRQLAGGVTTSQLLHGSANPIGGQSAIIKLRWGQTAESMKIENADGFIKFALGENVKQSNWGDHRTVRFPQTRMGVEQVFYDGFMRAKEYSAEWKIYQAKNNREKKRSNPPRRDLELEALAEILDSNRFITCHSYIQSEINMLLHVADSMDFQVNTFTHILEGYKVADKLKKHGAAASTFSDWWAYKFEVNDAIPYNGALLHRAGVLTGFNSDDAEMGRRLNQEAAKAVKYGGMSEEEAWKLVSLNPAKMLHLDDRIGSIKVGKDADLVLWSDHPLSIYTKAEQTYIDGLIYYDRSKSNEMQQKNLQERAKIIEKMMAKKEDGEETQDVKSQEKEYDECDSQ